MVLLDLVRIRDVKEKGSVHGGYFSDGHLLVRICGDFEPGA